MNRMDGTVSKFWLSIQANVRAVLQRVSRLSIAAALVVCAGTLCIPLTGCNDGPHDGQGLDNAAGTVVFQERTSPNEAYVSSEDDVVYYDIVVSQDADTHMVTVSCASNSAFFDPLSYTVNCDQAITQDDVTVRWTTAMGGSEPSEKDQLVVAHIAIAQDGQVIDEHVVNFTSGVVDILADALG